MDRRAKRRKGLARRARQSLAAAALLAAWGAGPSLARAAPEQSAAPTVAPRVDNRPFGRGTWGVSPNLGIGFSSDLIPLTLGVGGSYFVANGLGLGLSLNDTVLIYTSSFKARFPDVQNQIPTNSVYVTPTMRYVFYRNRRFSPYIFGALGPVFFNHGGGTRGYWAAGPGAFIGLGGPIYLNLGVVFSGIFPTDKCLESFEYADPSTQDRVQFDLGCGFGWGPSIGISFLPRARRQPKRRRRAQPPPGPTEPARNPFATPVEPEPAPAAVDPETEIDAAPPTDAPPTDAPPTDAPPTDAPPTDAPPTDAPPTDAPPTDAPPTDAPPTDAPPTDVPPTDVQSPAGADAPGT